MTSTDETKATTVIEGRPECALPPQEGTRRTPPYIQTPCTLEVFEMYQAHRKALGETWTTYILSALALRKETLEKREAWREQKRRQKQNKKAASGEAAPVD